VVEALRPAAGLQHPRHLRIEAFKPGAAPVPTEPGQGAFAAIGEIVDRIVADPITDRSRTGHGPVTVPDPVALPRLKRLGFFGVLTMGMPIRFSSLMPMSMGWFIQVPLSFPTAGSIR